VSPGDILAHQWEYIVVVSPIIVIPVTVPIIFPIIIVVLPVIVIPFRIVVLLRGFSIVEEQLQFNSAAYRPEVEIET
jgi:uncharacterized membrane protein YdbT with pleckstrin-like domain